MREHPAFDRRGKFAKDFALIRDEQEAGKRPPHVIRAYRAIRRDFDQDAPDSVVGVLMPDRGQRRDAHACDFVGVVRIATADDCAMNYVGLPGQLLLEPLRGAVAHAFRQFDDAIKPPGRLLADEVKKQAHWRAVINDLSKAWLGRLGENPIGLLLTRLRIRRRLKADAHFLVAQDKAIERALNRNCKRRPADSVAWPMNDAPGRCQSHVSILRWDNFTPRPGHVDSASELVEPVGAAANPLRIRLSFRRIVKRPSVKQRRFDVEQDRADGLGRADFADPLRVAADGVEVVIRHIVPEALANPHGRGERSPAVRAPPAI